MKFTKMTAHCLMANQSLVIKMLVGAFAVLGLIYSARMGYAFGQWLRLFE